MACRVLPSLFILGTLAVLAGCSPYQREERPPWRAQAEQACLAQNKVEESASIRRAPPLDGPGICGLTQPFKVTALAGGTVTLNSTATLDCSMIATLDTWIKDVVQPAAQARFGEPVVRINSMGSYSCRGINNMSGANLSEHSFGNAIDIGGFVLASGRELNIMRGFNGSDEQERAFLHEAHAGACPYFTTVLGPGYNVFHYNHFHVDLAQHGSTSRGPRRYCKPVPQQTLPEAPKRDNLPDPPPIEEEMDMARAPIPEPSLGRNGPSFVASVPPSAVPPDSGPPLAAPPLVAQSYRSAPPSMPASRPAIVAMTRARPAPRMAEPPSIVTFAEPGADPATEPPPQDPPPRLVARQPRRIAPMPEADNPDPAPEADPGPTADADPPHDPGNPADLPPPPRRRPVVERPTEGAPNDWDLTSSVRR